MTPANTATISRFGPSGSSSTEKNTFEHIKDVLPSSKNEIVFDLKYIDIHSIPKHN